MAFIFLFANHPVVLFLRIAGDAQKRERLLFGIHKRS